jgi:RNA polymerase subunit RPABC4/transcription elongation factor Spt4
MENRCVMCGAIIPEGRQVCPNCEKGQKAEEKNESETD